MTDQVIIDDTQVSLHEREPSPFETMVHIIQSAEAGDMPSVTNEQLDAFDSALTGLQAMSERIRAYNDSVTGMRSALEQEIDEMGAAEAEQLAGMHEALSVDVSLGGLSGLLAGPSDEGSEVGLEGVDSSELDENQNDAADSDPGSGENDDVTLDELGTSLLKYFAKAGPVRTASLKDNELVPELEGVSSSKWDDFKKDFEAIREEIVNHLKAKGVNVEWDIEGERNGRTYELVGLDEEARAFLAS